MEKINQEGEGNVRTDGENTSVDCIPAVSDGDSDGYSDIGSDADMSKPLMETMSARRDTMKSDAVAAITSTTAKYPGPEVILDLYPPKNYGKFLTFSIL